MTRPRRTAIAFLCAAALPGAASLFSAETNSPSLAESVNAPELVWTTSSNRPWRAQTAVTRDGFGAAVSGDVADDESTFLQATQKGPGTVSYWWKVSSETNDDTLRFYINGAEQARISGETAWQWQSFDLPAGNPVLQWKYLKDSSTSKGSDCGWLDAVRFSGLLYRTNAALLPGTNEIAIALQRANACFMANNARQTNGWARGVYHAANLRVYQVLGLPEYYNWSVQWASYFGWQPGWRGPTNADGQVCGQAYVDLYRTDPVAARIAAVRAGIENRVADPHMDDWWWCDAFFMAGPVYARFGNLLQTNKHYDKLWLLYQDMKVRRGLFDTNAGLWYRDADARTAKTENGRKEFWGRGNGWVIAACVRVLEQSPPSAAHRAEYISMLKTMAAALKPWQGSDGFWRSSLIDPDEFPNPETSATGLITYALAWGVRHRHLDAGEYGPIVARAWNGLARVALRSDGRVGYVQAQGKEPDAASSSETYDHGVAVFLLAGAEVLLLAAEAGIAPRGEEIDFNIAPSNSAVRLNWPARYLRTYEVQYKERLSDTNWQTLTPQATAVGVSGQADDSRAARSRFYRVIEH